MHRLVADTNTAISGLLSEGPAASIIRLAYDGRITLWGSSETFEEFCRVIRYPRIEKRIRSQYRGVVAFEREYGRILNLVAITGVLPGILVPADRDDEMFLRVAAAADSKFVISRDAHLLDLDELGAISIVSPEEFMVAWRSISGPAEKWEKAHRWRIPWLKWSRR